MASLFFLGYEDEIEHSISKEPVIETPVKLYQQKAITF